MILGGLNLARCNVVTVNMAVGAIILIWHCLTITCPSKSCPLIFKLVSCKPGASRELVLRPAGSEMLKMLYMFIKMFDHACISLVSKSFIKQFQH